MLQRGVSCNNTVATCFPPKYLAPFDMAQIRCRAQRLLKCDAMQPLADLLWTPAIAEAIALEDGVGPLNERHWRVIGYCREETARSGKPPTLAAVLRNCGYDARELSALFGARPRNEALRIAGLAGRILPGTDKKGTNR